MNLLNSKSVLRQILQVENLQHTINGGSTPIHCRLKEDENQFVITVKAPSVHVENLHVEVARNKVRIYNTFSFISEKGRLMMLPVNFKAFEIPENANQEMIEAFEEVDGTYVIQIPKGYVKLPKKADIPIKQRG